MSSTDATPTGRRWATPTTSSPRTRHHDVTTLVAVAVGGSLGAAARYGLAQAIGDAPDRFPWATFWTNVSGAFALGAVLTVLTVMASVVAPTLGVAALTRLVGTGFLGAFTTFSTFAVQTDLLIKQGRVGIAVVYVASSMIVGLAMAWLGITTGRAAASRWSRGRDGRHAHERGRPPGRSDRPDRSNRRDRPGRSDRPNRPRGT